MNPSATIPEDSLTSTLAGRIASEIAQAGGWIGFDRFMELALYTPGLGYYANASRKFGAMPDSGSDFVTAPEMTPLFGQTLAAQVAQVLEISGTHEVWEFGAGSGALALQLLDALGDRVARYSIVDLSGTLRERQRETLAAHAHKLQWLDRLPDRMEGMVVGNEVLDAMPVKLLARIGGVWHERGVTVAPEPTDGRDVATGLPDHATGAPEVPGAPDTPAASPRFAWHDRPTSLRPPLEVPGDHDYLTEIHLQAEAFIRTLADRLVRGAALFLDYGFGETEYYHPQRHMGTVMCHRGHRSDPDPLQHVGLKDITAHVNFTGIALAAQDAGLEVAGYTSQARFLINLGLVDRLEGSTLAGRTSVQRLIHEHEMGELFKALAMTKGLPGVLAGFAAGDRTHTL
jgi:SAM-dependent MidA family methyltransferase